ncbi:MAG: hypothetical protein AAF701_07385 [Pseudomonadota bacterium]
MRGFILGALWGLILGGMVLTLLSLISTVPGQAPPAVVLEAPPIETVPVTPGETFVPAPILSDTNRPAVDAADATVPPSTGIAALAPEVTTPPPQPDIATTGQVAVNAPTPQTALPGGPVAPATSGPTVLASPQQAVPPPPAVAVPAPILTTPNRVASPETPARSIYARPVEVDPEKPLMALILIDDPSRQLGPRTVSGLPFPVTVVVDANAADAAKRVGQYTDFGIEVMFQGDIARGLELTPQTVGYLTDGNGRTEQAQLADTGHALIAIDDLANGVAGYEVTWNLVGRSENGTVLRRFLDNAASGANRQEQIVLTNMSIASFNALLTWANGTRAGSVNVTPISMVINE